MADLSIAERIARINAECSGVWGTSGVTSWERERLEEWRGRKSLSDKQLEVLSNIEEKVFGEDNGE